MSQPYSINFRPDDVIQPYLALYPDLGIWLRQLGLHVPTQHDTWSSYTPEPESLLAGVARDMAYTVYEDAKDWSQEGISDLVHHLIATHHTLLRAELPRMHHLGSLLAQDNVILRDLHEDLIHLHHSVLAHLDVEEGHVFPLCLAIDQARFGIDLPHYGDVERELHRMSEDHHLTEADLQRVATKLDACPQQNHPDMRRLRTLCGNISRDLAIHAHKESAILLPATLHLANLIGTRLERRSPHASP